MSTPPILPTSPLYCAFFLRTLSHASSLGADSGECLAALQDAGGAPTGHSWAVAWSKQARRLEEHAAELQKHNPPQKQSAKEAYLRASNYHRTAFAPLFGYPLDKETVMPAYQGMRRSFAAAAELFEPPLEPLRMPFQGTTLRGYLCRPPVLSNDRLLVLVSGYDAPMEEMYFWTAHHALQRGYSVVFFDGPGQGGTLLNDGVKMSHNYDEVLAAVLDGVAKYGTWKYTIAEGLSFGGILSLKAAASKSVQDRVDALIADPPNLSPLDGFRNKLPFPSSVADRLPEGPGWAVRLLELMLNWMQSSNFPLGWVLRRGMLVHGCSTPTEFIRSLVEFDNEPYVKHISIPVLFTKAKGDDLAANAEDVLDRLTACKTKKLVTFTREQGADDHCEIGARSFFNATVFAWLDELFS